MGKFLIDERCQVKRNFTFIFLISKNCFGFWVWVNILMVRRFHDTLKLICDSSSSDTLIAEYVYVPEIIVTYENASTSEKLIRKLPM